MGRIHAERPERRDTNRPTSKRVYERQANREVPTVTGATANVTVRQARADDADAVAAFTSDTWSERGVGDYLADVFPRWVETDGPTQRTFVVDVDGTAVGTLQCVLLSDREAWAQGMRIDPAHRGEGLSMRLSRAAFRWARQQGATVCRNMVFSWNVAGLGQSRATGFDPETEFRFATPTPEETAEPAMDVGSDPDAAWTFWTDSDARTALAGLAMDFDESWAVSELTIDDLKLASEDDRLLTVADGGVRGFAVRAYTNTREVESDDAESDESDDTESDASNDAESDDTETEEATDDTETSGEERTQAVYAIGAWADASACESVIDAVRRDAASVDADEIRLFVPESVRWVSDVAAARTSVSEEPDFVMAADLTDPAIGADPRD